MTITIVVTRAKLALAILAAALLVPATAFAGQVFDDVPDGKFYAEPVAWAFDNDITTGKGPGVFAPDDAVTRGETVTFLKRRPVPRSARTDPPTGPSSPCGQSTPTACSSTPSSIS